MCQKGNDDTLWHAAGPVAEGTVTALLGTLPEQQSSDVMLLLTAFSYGQTWQQPLDSNPAVSLTSKQTNYSSVGLHSSSAATAPPAPFWSRQRQQSVPWLANERFEAAEIYIYIQIDFTLIFS